MWAADGNVHWLARVAGAALGSASGGRGPHQAPSAAAAAAAVVAVEMEDGVGVLRRNSQLMIHTLGGVCFHFCRFRERFQLGGSRAS